MPHLTEEHRMKGRKIRTALLTFVSLLIVAAPAVHAEGNGSRLPVAGDEAILFGVTQNFTLSTFDGTTIAWRKHQSDSTAWRFGLSLNTKWASEDREREQDPPNPFGYTDERTDDQTDLDVSVAAYRVRYLTMGDQNRLYHGYGPRIGYQRIRREQIINGTTDDYERDNIFVGLANIVGVEWFRWEKISLFAEYGATLGYTRSTVKDVDGSRSQTDTNTTNNVALSSNGVRFGLAARF
jgi:hypothetical protein